MELKMRACSLWLQEFFLLRECTESDRTLAPRNDKESWGSLQLEGLPLLGQHMPACTANGWYHYEQRSPSTGYSWRVMPYTGAKIPGSEVPPAAHKSPNCHKCLKEQAQKLPPVGMIGSDWPDCDEKDGSYKPFQNAPSSGYSWRVDRETGEEIPGTMTPPGEPEPNCWK